MTTYALANDDLKETLAAVLDEYHPHLRDAQVSVDVLLAHASTDANGDTSGPALRLHGYACVATIRIVSLKDRVAGRGDAEMLVDGDRCDTWSDEQLRAIFDHELTHLELQVSDQGNVRRDDIDRPLLRIRRHDHQFGWFDSVARRHGKHSIEVQQAHQLTAMAELRQLYLPGIPEVAGKRAKKGTAR
jgi:hypothetical protein